MSDVKGSASGDPESEMDDALVIMRELAKVQKLLDDHGNLDLEKEPYKKKYEAIEKLKALETEIVNVLKDTAEDKKANWFLMLSSVHLNTGLMHVATEELKAGEEQFTKCIEILKGRELDPKAVIMVLTGLNQLGIVWSQWGQPTKAKVFLEQAEQIYNDFTDTSKGCYKEPIDFGQCFGSEETDDELDAKETLEKVHTLTLYYLAQVYGSLKDHDKSAVYCHMTLRRQLGVKDIQRGLDYIDWALNAATLSQYFMETNGFTQARHHLAAASYILQKYEGMLKEKDDTEEQDEAHAADWENFKHRSADVARCWAKYGILLLSLSKQRLLEKAERDEETDQPEKQDIPKPNVIDNLRFDVFENEIEAIANQITDKYLLDFSDARTVFANTQKWLEQAKAYYTLDNHASDHVLIAQDMADAYKYLAFYEEHEDRQAKMHKRRIDILEAVIKELNPQYYKPACRQIWIVLGESYSDILDIKLDRLRLADENPTPRALAKINRLAKSAISNFQLFLDSLETHASGAGIKQFSDDITQQALLVYFHLGRLYNKIITPDKTLQLENTQNSINAYKFVVDYCDKYPKAAELMKVELGLCKELVSLLPLKINRLRQEMIN